MDIGAVREPTRVLLVEDQPVNRKVITRMLETLGCVVTLAEDGVIGVELAKDEPDLILMDCSMPRCDGFEATRLIRALPGAVARIPIVALTAHALPADRARCLDAGMDDFLTKPVAPDGLAGVLRRHARWSSPPAASVADGVMDARIVGQLLALGGPDDHAFFDELVEDFTATTALTLREARDLFAAARLHDLRRAVHRLKSASATIGAVRLREACSRLEGATDSELDANGSAWLRQAEFEAGLATQALQARVAA